MSGIQRLVLVRADRVRVVRRRFGPASLGVILAVAACAATTVTLRSNHFRLTVPVDWQVVEPGGGGEIPTLVRAPAKDGAPEVDVRIFPWLVSDPPRDAAGDALGRLVNLNVLGLASAHADDADPCTDRPAQFFVFGKPARAIHLTNTEGRHIVVTAGESRGSLVAMVGALPPGASGCAATGSMDAVIERLAASMTSASDLLRPTLQPALIEDSSGRPSQLPSADPAPPP